MSSHLDNARKELSKQRTLVLHEIGQLTRQLNKIDKAIDNLAPISNGHTPKNRPTMDESQRREEVLSTFCKDWNVRSVSREFDMDDFLDVTQEPYGLRSAYQSLVRSRKHMFETTDKRGVYKILKKEGS